MRQNCRLQDSLAKYNMSRRNQVDGYPDAMGSIWWGVWNTDQVLHQNVASSDYESAEGSEIHRAQLPNQSRNRCSDSSKQNI